MSAVEVRLEPIELPTYETLPEKPDPCFTKRLGAHIYPYRLQDSLTKKRVIRTYESVVLENELLRLTFLPDFGCRLFSVHDKLLGREVFHRNDCIKPTLIATRGAWISGGIEFNFPVSHSVYTHSRIPFTTRRNADGSASMIFGLTERMTEMRFTVEVRLVPGEYRFSDTIRLYNGTPLPHRHYWWTNTAVYSTPDARLIYAMTRGISGAYGENTTWPVCEGIDLSRIGNHAFTGDIFGAETYDEFFGVYYDDADHGVAHWSRQDEMPGRKVFCWGQDEMGKLWQSMLTENAGDYLEIQSGRFATQSDFDLLRPHELVEMTEFWLPVGPTGGFVKAHREGIVNVRSNGSVALQMTRPAPGGTVRIIDGGSAVSETKLDLDAGEVRSFDVSADPERTSVEVLDAGGNIVLAYDPQRKSRVRDIVPRTSVAPKQQETPGDILQAARSRERHDCAENAIRAYEKLIGTEHEAEARKGLARFALAAGRYRDAIDQAQTVLASQGDREANSLLALALEGQGDDAQDIWRALAGDPDLGTLARRRLAEHFIRRGELEAVAGFASDSTDPMLTLMGIIAARKQGYSTWAQDRLSALVETDPLWRHARWESYFLSGRKTGAPELSSECFQEDMDAAGMYFGLGLRDETKAIVKAWILAGPPSDPLLRVLIEELGMEPPSEYHADEWGVVNCFAHRDVLMRLLDGRNDAESLTDLGNMLYARGRVDEAIEKWQAACRNGGGYLPHRNLGIAFWHKKDDLQTAYGYMSEANGLCPDNPVVLRDLDILAELSGAEQDRLDIACRIMEYAPNDSGCLERAVRAYLAADKLDEAVELLQTRTFFVAELAYQTRILYVWAMIRRGMRRMAEKQYADAASDFRAATEYPPNLGASRFHDSSDAQAFYLLGEALSSMDDVDGARGAWTLAADDAPVRGAEQAFYVGKARERLGRDDAQEAYAKILPAEESADTPEAEARLNYLRRLERSAAGDEEAAREYLRLAQEFERANPAKMRRYMESLAYTRSEGRRVPIAVW